MVQDIVFSMAEWYRGSGVSDPNRPADPTFMRPDLGWRNAKAFAIAHVVARQLIRPSWAPLLRWIARHRRIVLPGSVDFYLSFYIHRLLLIKLGTEWHRRLAESLKVSAPITVFGVREGEPDSNRDVAAWGQHSTAATMLSVGGDHYTMFDPPHLADLCAQFIAACAAKPEWP